VALSDRMVETQGNRQILALRFILCVDRRVTAAESLTVWRLGLCGG
jgi:hypothetical protein